MQKMITPSTPEIPSSLTQSYDLLHKIREFTRSVLNQICLELSPRVFVNRFKICCTDGNGQCHCSSTLLHGQDVLSFKSESCLHRFNILLKVLSIVQRLLQENKNASKRDIYYMHPEIFSNQAIVDRAINDICILFNCSRHNLNVVSVSKGCVMGWFKFLEASKVVNCISNPNTAYPIPVSVEGVKDVVSVAKYILVVEKESLFLRLSDDRFCDTNRCIVITGRGYPDIPTRRFLKLLVETLCLPAFCLVDCDPYGFDILTTYRFGSMKMAYDAESLRVPGLSWLGVLPSDVDRHGVPQQCLLPLTPEDKRRVESMLQRCYLKREAPPHWRVELELMLERGVKFETEALSTLSLSFLSEEYLPSKFGMKYNKMHI